ncbi:thiamine pyrophosphokinase [[Emmonsia] crescens]|uniref:Thiamine pyrophosphokinase n=1 Tax=[Emmonsia] crescens TaxID=73230 RepID=A0A2B7ZTS3_9EURO|nr:thiamine pyrophosphokinase [Emmonsia crescens]
MDWYPAQFFNTAAPPSSPFALLVLNQPINQNAYKILKKHASFTICADGGANRLYNLMRASGRESIELPDAIVGDLDSISPEVRKHYEDLHVPVIHDPDQYSTDVTKCLCYLRSHTQSIIAPSNNKNGTAAAAAATTTTATIAERHHRHIDVLLLGGLGGRVDQAFSLINHLYISSTSTSTAASTANPSTSSASSSSPPPLAPHEHNQLYLISEESISFILRRGHNKIHTPGGSLMGISPPPPPRPTQTTQTTQPTPLSENIGIIPIAGPAVITTHGLEWDVQDWKTHFGGQVSTSNHVRSEVVEVEVDADVPVLFTVELAGWVKGAGVCSI